jgi:hypothetical protein
MKKLNEKLSEVLDVEPIELAPVSSLPVVTHEDDTEYARENIKNLIDNGNLAVKEILSVANQSEHPRAYEVAATLIKTMADLNKDLLQIQKHKREMNPVEKPQSGINVQNAVFVGSTAELLKQLKNNK